MIKNLTIAMPYYESPEMLRTHLQYWSEYPEEIWDKVRVVIVDDGSPKHPAIHVLKGQKSKISIELYRITENIPWNIPGVRNLCMSVIKEEDQMILNTDMDLVLPKESIEELFRIDLDTEKTYWLSRKQLNGGKWKDIKLHKETFIMTSEMFWSIGGFDEDFTGYWNGAFYPFIKNWKKRSHPIVLDSVYLLDYSPLVDDATTKDWGRGQSSYDLKQHRVLISKQHHSAHNYSPKNHLRFKWEKVI